MAADAESEWFYNKKSKMFEKRMAPSRAYRDEGGSCCGMAFLRYIVYLFSILSTLCGALFILLAVYLYIIKSELLPLLHSELYEHCLYLMAGIGLVLTLNCCLCCSATNSRCVASVYILVIFVMLVLEGLLGYAIILETQQLKRTIASNFQNDVFNEYGVDMKLSRAIDTVQIEGKCCGARGFDDYMKDVVTEDPDEDEEKVKVQYVPDSCCRSPSKGCGINDHPSNIHYAGCETFLIDTARDHLYYICTLTIASFFVQSVLLLFACCVCIKGPKQMHERLDKRRAEQEMSLFD